MNVAPDYVMVILMGRQRRPARDFDAAGAAFRLTHLHKALGLRGLIFPELSPFG